MISSEAQVAGFKTLERDSRHYAQRFADTFHPYVQDQLDLGRFSDLHEQIHNERILKNTDMERGIIGGDFEFTRKLARQAFAAGVIGYWVQDYEAELTDTEVSIATEELSNEFYQQPKPKTKHPNDPHFHEIFTKDELTQRMAFWYKIGAENRIGGFVDERRELDEKEKNNE